MALPVPEDIFMDVCFQKKTQMFINMRYHTDTQSQKQREPVKEFRIART